MCQSRTQNHSSVEWQTSLRFPEDNGRYWHWKPVLVGTGPAAFGFGIKVPYYSAVTSCHSGGDNCVDPYVIPMFHYCSSKSSPDPLHARSVAWFSCACQKAKSFQLPVHCLGRLCNLAPSKCLVPAQCRFGVWGYSSLSPQTLL